MKIFDTKTIREELSSRLHNGCILNEKVAIYGGIGTIAQLRLTPRESKGVIPAPEYFIVDHVIEHESTINDALLIDFESAHKLCKSYQIVLYGTSYDQIKHMFNCLKNSPIEDASIHTIEEVVYCQNADKILAVFDMLEDDFSKATYANMILFRMGKIEQDKELIRPSTTQYFDLPLFANPDGNEVFVDCGAYVGDTIEKYLMIKCGCFKKIVAFEPMSRSFSALGVRMERLKREWAISNDRVELVNGGVGEKPYRIACTLEEEETLAESSDASCFTLEGRNFTQNEGGIPVYSLDKYFAEQPVSFIKADIEGFEWRMLVGARRIIKRDHPQLALCLYHNYTDIFTIPMKIKLLCPDYKLYIRHHAYGYYETVLYACVDQ